MYTDIHTWMQSELQVISVLMSHNDKAQFVYGNHSNINSCIHLEQWPWSFSYNRGAQTFWVKSRCGLFLAHSRAEDKIMIWIFESQVSKTGNKLYL